MADEEGRQEDREVAAEARFLSWRDPDPLHHRLDRSIDPRLRAILSLARRHDWEQGHSQQVTSLALSLFDQLRDWHGYGIRERDLLHYAGLLHDIGLSVDVKGHNKHSRDIIMGSRLPGFATWELQIIAGIARYHRKRLPREGDRELESLNEEQKKVLFVLAGILRVADGLDRSHLSLVRAVEAMLESDRLVLKLASSSNVDEEIYYAKKKADLLTKLLAREVVFFPVIG